MGRMVPPAAKSSLNPFRLFDSSRATIGLSDLANQAQERPTCRCEIVDTPTKVIREPYAKMVIVAIE
jgi:hypothetical protein